MDEKTYVKYNERMDGYYKENKKENKPSAIAGDFSSTSLRGSNCSLFQKISWPSLSSKLVKNFEGS